MNVYNLIGIDLQQNFYIIIDIQGRINNYLINLKTVGISIDKKYNVVTIFRDIDFK